MASEALRPPCQLSMSELSEHRQLEPCTEASLDSLNCRAPSSDTSASGPGKARGLSVYLECVSP